MSHGRLGGKLGRDRVHQPASVRPRKRGWAGSKGGEMGGGKEGLSALRDECPQCVRAVPSVRPCVEVGAAAHSRSACPGGELCPGTRVRPAAVSIVVNADLSECYILFSEAGSAHQ